MTNAKKRYYESRREYYELALMRAELSYNTLAKMDMQQLIATYHNILKRGKNNETGNNKRT